MKISHEKSWAALERRLGLSNLEAFINKEVRPSLSEFAPPPETKKGLSNAVTWTIIISCGVFMGSFMLIENKLPRNALGAIGSAIVFPTLFLVSILLCIYLFRDKIAELIPKIEDNFILRSQILSSIAAKLGMDYVSTPGGMSKDMQSLANWGRCPKTIKNILTLMESHRGLERQSEIIRQSGLVLFPDIAFGSNEMKRKSYEDGQENLQFQDGFSGTRNEIEFAAMEWENKSADVTDHHLLILLTLPHKLTGWVEFKSKSCPWPKSRPNVVLKKVATPYSPFSKTYDVRASDQTEGRLVFDPNVIEALSHFAADGPSRGVAFGNHLVFDIQGEKRCNFVNMATGQWSEESLKQTFIDIAQMLELVDAAVSIFTLKVQRTAQSASYTQAGFD